MVVIKTEEQIRQEAEDEQKLYDEYYTGKAATDFDFAKGIVSGISGDENSMRALFTGKKDKIANAGKSISTGMFLAQVGNLGLGMVVGGIGNRAGGRAGVRASDPLEASKLLRNLPWYKNVPRGGNQGRAGRFEKASDKFTTKDIVDQLAIKYPFQKFSPQLREALENSPALRNEIAKINARPNYYRALGSVEVLTRAKTELTAEVTKLKGEISSLLMESRGDAGPGLPQKLKNIAKLEGDIKDLGKRIVEHESDRVFYEKSEAGDVMNKENKPQESWQSKFRKKAEADRAEALEKAKATKPPKPTDVTAKGKSLGTIGELQAKFKAVDKLAKKRISIENRLNKLNRLLERQIKGGIEGSPEYMKTYAEKEKAGRELLKNESEGMEIDPEYMKLIISNVK